MKPYLSVVVVTRNDNYGGGLIGRLQTFQRVIVELCTEAELPAEIVLVDWNPPAGNPGMAEVISSFAAGTAMVTLRVVTVPASVHAGLPLASRRAVFEYIGKNAGIRRASGEFILATNPDTVFSTRLVEKLKKRQLREDTFYRADRADVVSPVPQGVPVAQIEEYCRQNILRVHGRWFNPGLNNRSLQYRLHHWPSMLRRVMSSALRYRMSGPLHFGAPGDFILMHQRQWHRIRGLPELELFADRSWNLDTLAVITARHRGLRQEVFGDHCVLYHQEHDRPDRTEQWEPSIRFVYDAMHALHRPWCNSAEWGLGTHTLPDQIV